MYPVATSSNQAVSAAGLDIVVDDAENLERAWGFQNSHGDLRRATRWTFKGVVILEEK